MLSFTAERATLSTSSISALGERPEQLELAGDRLVDVVEAQPLPPQFVDGLLGAARVQEPAPLAVAAEAPHAGSRWRATSRRAPATSAVQPVSEASPRKVTGYSHPVSSVCIR